MTSKEIETGLKRFKSYLDRTNMDHKPHQMEGITWCLTNELRVDPHANVRGGFIADEMGLGKTILMIGLCVSNFMKRTLIILPPILIDQWYHKIYETTGHKPIVYHGEDKKTITKEALNDSIIVIATYNAITISKSQLDRGVSSLLHSISWNRIIFDEAHHLRNKGTGKYIGAKQLQANIRWLVSGTPVQNSKDDFYTLCSALNMSPEYYKNPDNLISIAKNFILKRTKEEANINLPEVNIENTVIDWKNKKEKELSEEIHSGLKFSKTECENRTIVGAYLNSEDAPALTLMLRAKQTCILPKLLVESLNKLVEKGIISNYDYYKEAFEYSSKLDSVIDTILLNHNNGCGKLVFCHYRDEINTISERLVQKGINKIATFDGRTSQGKRSEILNGDNEVLILQIQIGCEGLNLQDKYSEIYFVSPHWNPAVEEQAIARCHRIGQKNNVKVYRFIMSNFVSEEDKTKGITIDTYVKNIQESKKIIAENVMDCTENNEI
jgi:SNF2 family DNA or RNA helicase